MKDEVMVEIEKASSPVVTAVQQRTTEADGIVALVRQRLIRK
jgi:hypothetical protein